MSKKIIEFAHDLRDYECMWSGIEFIYGAKKGEWVPDFGFFAMSGVGNFIYLKGENFRQAAWSNGMVNKMYDFMAPIVGFSYEYVEGLAFNEMMEKAKAEIDEGRPVILGPVDMYYLKYFAKIYKHMHIPVHYIMMTGYDEEKIYIIDGGTTEVQTLTYGEIEEALVSERTELGAGTVPQPPMRLFGAPEKGDVLHQAGREKLVNVLKSIGEANGVLQWTEAAELFEESGRRIENIVNLVVDLLLNKRQELDEVPSLILEIADIEEKAYKKLLIREK